MINDSLDNPASFPACVSQRGRRRRWEDATDREVWDRLEAVERIQTAELAEIRQELKLLKARIGQAGQTASNIQVDLGSIVARVEQRVSALEARVAPSHRE
ncbi:hypothetical protein PF005_g23328 [Phytophthora fragariae]|uniref:Uncharacterized protein n=1 Tax=Phytophthora fragariae TaxID=53985 RepID=A0A6A3QKG9_9STRA|nr:hypothetical protein PF003_g32176 [Phytophthora fragariae]KAE8928555.1 hypothetical protein PF009_g21305 [Phytophthora fragariae]KAE8956640.1 hypothetical protein PF011_g31408 [Phytophthora fragariae]KAE9055352.1 hypothetical protein PF010_g32186 [Phytophthora fragariae]KAE9078313.1 hypothetical protein PF007_g23914 [Phytophthora fragariae]